MKILEFSTIVITIIATTPTVKTDNITSIYQGCEKFSSNYYHELVEESIVEDKVTAPVFPVYTLLSLLRHGTEGVIEELLTNHISIPQNKLLTAIQFQETLRRLQSDDQLHISNAVFMNCNYEFKPLFMKTALLYYNASLVMVNFTDLGEAAKFMNDIHSSHTEGNVDDVIDVSDLGEGIDVIFGSASYYEIYFLYGFNKKLTKRKRFYEDKYHSILLNFMEMRGVVLNYTKSNQELIASVLELPLANPSFVAIFILPILKSLGVEHTDNVISSDPEVVTRAIYNLREEKLLVSIPKFRIEYGNSKLLSKDYAANYTFIKDNPGDFNLLINFKTIILMNDEDGIYEPLEVPDDVHMNRFKLNRPFIFLIYNKEYNFTMFRTTFYSPYNKIYRQQCDNQQ